MKQEYKDQIKKIQELNDVVVKYFDLFEGMKKIPSEHEINILAMEIDRAIMSDSKRVRAEALDLTGWMSELARRGFKLEWQQKKK